MARPASQRARRQTRTSRPAPVRCTGAQVQRRCSAGGARRCSAQVECTGAAQRSAQRSACATGAVQVQCRCSARHLGVPQCLHGGRVGAVERLVEARLRRQQRLRLGRRRRRRRRARARDADGGGGGGGLLRRVGDLSRGGLHQLAEAVAHGLEHRAEQLVPARRAQRGAEGAPAQVEPDPRACSGPGLVVRVGGQGWGRARARARARGWGQAQGQAELNRSTHLRPPSPCRAR